MRNCNSFGTRKSATSSSNTPAAPQADYNRAPPPQAMEPTSALGIWQSNFGGVKIEADNSKGGIAQGAVHGVWSYKRDNAWVEFGEDKKGQLAPGYMADIAILSGDIEATEPENIETLTAAVTICNGKISWTDGTLA